MVLKRSCRSFEEESVEENFFMITVKDVKCLCFLGFGYVNYLFYGDDCNLRHVSLV